MTTQDRKTAGRPRYAPEVVQEQKQVILDLLAEGKNMSEVAELLGVSRVTVYNRLKRGEA